jgi:hypothetical protein
MSLAANDTDTDITAARVHFVPEMQQVMRDIRRNPGRARPSQLICCEAVQRLTLRERFNEPANAQSNFTAAYLARRQAAA